VTRLITTVTTTVMISIAIAVTWETKRDVIQISHDLLLDRRKMPKAFLADGFTSVGFRYRLLCFPVERLRRAIGTTPQLA
jgi:hypothetical protein